MSAYEGERSSSLVWGSLKVYFFFLSWLQENVHQSTFIELQLEELLRTYKVIKSEEKGGVI